MPAILPSSLQLIAHSHRILLEPVTVWENFSIPMIAGNKFGKSLEKKTMTNLFSFQTKFSSALSIKKKGVGNLVAKWNDIQDKEKRNK